MKKIIALIAAAAALTSSLAMANHQIKPNPRYDSNYNLDISKGNNGVSPFWSDWSANVGPAASGHDARFDEVLYTVARDSDGNVVCKVEFAVVYDPVASANVRAVNAQGQLYDAFAHVVCPSAGKETPIQIMVQNTTGLGNIWDTNSATKGALLEDMTRVQVQALFNGLKKFYWRNSVTNIVSCGQIKFQHQDVQWSIMINGQQAVDSHCYGT